MSPGEIDRFLADRGHGVLSFAGDQPYGIPVSYGFDDVGRRCVFQLFFDEGSRKGAALAASERVSLAVYEYNGVDDWRSVVVERRLAPIPEGSHDAVDAADVFAELASVVAMTVFDSPIEEIDPEWFSLDIEEMSGRQSHR
jgi:nitroimidazol reductase NimA-like FMN-containing flavoprotein (pyridoxamine 5'-phosphate oxidase superfamily)